MAHVPAGVGLLEKNPHARIPFHACCVGDFKNRTARTPLLLSEGKQDGADLE